MFLKLRKTCNTFLSKKYKKNSNGKILNNFLEIKTLFI